MTFEEFLKYVRDHIGRYCTDAYWKYVYDILIDKSPEYIKREMPFLAVNAVGIQYANDFADEDSRNAKKNGA